MTVRLPSSLKLANCGIKQILITALDTLTGFYGDRLQILSLISVSSVSLNTKHFTRVLTATLTQQKQ